MSSVALRLVAATAAVAAVTAGVVLGVGHLVDRGTPASESGEVVLVRCWDGDDRPARECGPPTGAKALTTWVLESDLDLDCEAVDDGYFADPADTEWSEAHLCAVDDDLTTYIEVGRSEWLRQGELREAAEQWGPVKDLRRGGEIQGWVSEAPYEGQKAARLVVYVGAPYYLVLSAATDRALDRLSEQVRLRDARWLYFERPD